MLTDKEAETIAVMVVRTAEEMDKREASEEELANILEWAQMARVNDGMLRGVLDGTMFVRWQNGEVLFSITPKGTAEVEAMTKSGSPRSHDCPMCGGSGSIKVRP